MKWRIPLTRHKAGAIDCPLPLVTLCVRDRYGAWVPLTFRVDTQAGLTVLPISLARREAIPFRESNPGRARGIVGAVRKYRDRIRIRIGEREHDWPCDFTEAAPDQETGQPLPELLPVLGRAGFLADYAIAVDDGYLIVTRLGPLRRLWRRGLQALWAACGMIHPADRPL